MAAGDPLVSVIVPVHNGAAGLGETLDSALRQTYPRTEVIVVDDGSEDESHAIAEAFARRDSRVRVVAQENRGVAAARNRAIGAASGDLIAPLDADDLWDPSKIERQVRRLLSGGGAAGLVYCWWLWIDEGGGVLDASPRWHIEGQAADALLQVNFCGSASVPLFRRNSLEQAGGYDESFRARGSEGCEDWDLALKIAERAPVAVEPAYLVGYRRRPAAMSTRTDAMWRSHACVVSAVRARRLAIAPALIRRSDQQFVLYLAGVSFRSGRVLQALRWTLRAAPSAFWFWTLPHIARVLWTSVFDRRPRRRIASGAAFSRDAIPPSLIPYDRFYAGGERRRA